VCSSDLVFSWVLMFALYFVPYALMVGELGSAFKNSGGGVSSWVHETFGPKLAYYAGWTYWACHVTYIASKGSGGLKALSWAIFENVVLRLSTLICSSSLHCFEYSSRFLYRELRV